MQKMFRNNNSQINKISSQNHKIKIFYTKNYSKNTELMIHSFKKNLII